MFKYLFVINKIFIWNSKIYICKSNVFLQIAGTVMYLFANQIIINVSSLFFMSCIYVWCGKVPDDIPKGCRLKSR